MTPHKRLYELHAAVCQTLANPKRLEILDHLRERELSVGELAATMRLSPSNVSQHLAVMRQHDIVLARREGLNIYYRIANPKITKACGLMREVLLDHLQSGAKLAAISGCESGIGRMSSAKQSQ